MIPASPPGPAPDLAARGRLRLLIVAFLLVALTIAALGGVVGNGFITFDDDAYLTDNKIIPRGLTLEGLRRAFFTVWQANWHPLTWVSHMVDAQLFGMRPGMHHAVGLALHAGSAVMLLLLLHRLTGALWRPALVAALFAIHPLQVESVAWAAERKTVLSLALMLAAALAYERAARRGRVGSSVAVPALFALSLMSKPMVVTFPFLLLLLDAWPLGRWGAGAPAAGPATGPLLTLRRLLPPAPLWVEKLPLLALALVISLVTLLVQGTAGAIVLALPLWQRLANALVSYARYLGKMLWPVDLAHFYPYAREGYSALVWIGSLFLLALLTGVALRAARRVPSLAVGWLWFLGSLVPMIGLVQVGSQALADRYAYLPLIGIAVALVWGGTSVLVSRRLPLLPAAGCVLAVLAALAVGSRIQAARWQDDETLFSHTLRVTTDNWSALNSLGVHRMRNDRTDEALPLFERAAAIAPNVALVHNNLGGALSRVGRYDEAIARFAEALALASDDARPHNNLGYTLFQKGDAAAAVPPLLRAVELDPECMEAHNNLGWVFVKLGRIEEAYAAFSRAVALVPDAAEPRYALGRVCYLLGRLPEALAGFEEAIRLRPRFFEAHYDLGTVLQALGREAEAQRHRLIAEALRSGHTAEADALAREAGFPEDPETAAGLFRRALEINPKDAGARESLAIALLQVRRIEEAIRELRAVLETRPSAQTYTNLGSALAMAGRPGESDEAFRAALALEPASVEAHLNYGIALDMRGDLPGACRHLLEAAALAPGDGRAPGVLEEILARPGAREAFEKARAADPTLRELPPRLRAGASRPAPGF
ncbi:MAG TPA: tetratricopeptide repeat protein [Candidatus Methanoperedens sp.]|nr:tetratricopeptide repeat protein [Candidatus Methanoperedens sp.]